MFITLYNFFPNGFTLLQTAPVYQQALLREDRLFNNIHIVRKLFQTCWNREVSFHLSTVTNTGAMFPLEQVYLYLILVAAESLQFLSVHPLRGGTVTSGVSGLRCWCSGPVMETGRVRNPAAVLSGSTR